MLGFEINKTRCNELKDEIKEAEKQIETLKLIVERNKFAVNEIEKIMYGTFDGTQKPTCPVCEPKFSFESLKIGLDSLGKQLKSC